MKKLSYAALCATVLVLSITTIVLAEIGWVGNMTPMTGEINGAPGETFSVSCEVWKDGCTGSGGPCVDITDAELVYAEVDSFGGAWQNQQEASMAYTGYSGNNDVYEGTLSVTDGDIQAFQRYEYKCRFSDDNGSTYEWPDSNNGQLTVLGPNAVTLTQLTGRTPILTLAAGLMLALGAIVAWRRK